MSLKTKSISKTKVLNTIKEFWEMYPEMNLGEFLTTFIPAEFLTVIEDEDLVKVLEECVWPVDGEA